MRTGAALSLLVVLLACRSSPDPGTSGVVLQVAPEVAAAGEPVVLTLTNGTSAPVGYNLCTSALERESDGSWLAVPSDRVCTMELRTLEPGNRADYTYELPDDLAPGDYRFETSVHDLGTGAIMDVRSEPFRVEG